MRRDLLKYRNVKVKIPAESPVGDSQRLHVADKGAFAFETQPPAVEPIVDERALRLTRVKNPLLTKEDELRLTTDG